ncbi:MAG: hypothetical protein AAFX50_22170, partial [Acidobacteriota bacterium]
CAARNRGFELTEAPYFIPLDSDNRLREGPFLDEAIASLEADPGLGVVYGDRYEFGLREGRQEGAAFDLKRMLRGNYIDTCAVIRRATWLDVGGYDEELPTWEDWELWIRIARRGWTLRHLDAVAFDYRVRPGSLVSTTEDPQVLRAILDRVVTTHRDVFEDFLVERLGHSLGAWPFLLLDQKQRSRRTDADSREDSGDSARGSFEPSVGSPETFELARARLAASEAARKADAAAWRLEHARTSATHFEDSARQLRDTLAARDEVVTLQKAALEDWKARAELAEVAHGRIKAEAAAREEKLLRLDRERDEAVRAEAELRREVEALGRVYREAVGQVEELRNGVRAAERDRDVLSNQVGALRDQAAALDAEAGELRDEVGQQAAVIDSRAYRIARLWWSLIAKLRPGGG